MKKKSPLKSKTLWANALAIVFIFGQSVLGEELFSVELQTAILAVINILLRAVTSEPIGGEEE